MNTKSIAIFFVVALLLGLTNGAISSTINTFEYAKLLVSFPCDTTNHQCTNKAPSPTTTLALDSTTNAFSSWTFGSLGLSSSAFATYTIFGVMQASDPVSFTVSFGAASPYKFGFKLQPAAGTGAIVVYDGDPSSTTNKLDFAPLGQSTGLYFYALVVQNTPVDHNYKIYISNDAATWATGDVILYQTSTQIPGNLAITSAALIVGSPVSLTTGYMAIVDRELDKPTLLALAGGSQPTGLTSWGLPHHSGEYDTTALTTATNVYSTLYDVDVLAANDASGICTTVDEFNQGVTSQRYKENTLYKIHNPNNCATTLSALCSVIPNYYVLSYPPPDGKPGYNPGIAHRLSYIMNNPISDWHSSIAADKTSTTAMFVLNPTSDAASLGFDVGYNNLANNAYQTFGAGVVKVYYSPNGYAVTVTLTPAEIVGLTGASISFLTTGPNTGKRQVEVHFEVRFYALDGYSSTSDELLASAYIDVKYIFNSDVIDTITGTIAAIPADITDSTNGCNCEIDPTVASDAYFATSLADTTSTTTTASGVKVNTDVFVRHVLGTEFATAYDLTIYSIAVINPVTNAEYVIVVSSIATMQGMGNAKFAMPSAGTFNLRITSTLSEHVRRLLTSGEANSQPELSKAVVANLKINVSPMSSESSDEGKSNTATIIAIVCALGGVILILGGSTLFYCLRLRRKASSEPASEGIPQGTDRGLQQVTVAKNQA